jgi:membrane protein DedA with SNARE-associated domain
MGSLLDLAGVIVNAVDSGRPLVLGAVFAVNALGEMGIPFPFVMQVALFLAGYQLATGNALGACLLMTAALLGSISGATLLYWASRFLGVNLLRLGSRFTWLHRRRIAEAGTKLKATNALAIALGRLVPGLLAPVSFVAGTTRIPWPRFMAAVGLSELLWIGPLVALGIAAGLTGHQLESALKSYSKLMALGIAVVASFVVGRFVWRRFRA